MLVRQGRDRSAADWHVLSFWKTDSMRVGFFWLDSDCGWQLRIRLAAVQLPAGVTLG